MRGKSASEKVSERTSERKGFQRFSDVFTGFERFVKGPLRAPLRVPFSSQSCGSCCPLRVLQVAVIVFSGVELPGLLLAGNRAEKPILWVPVRRGRNEDFQSKGGKIAEDRTLTDVN